MATTVISQPSQIHDLYGSPKERWKFQHHKSRWEKRYKKPYIELNGRASFWVEMKIIDNET